MGRSRATSVLSNQVPHRLGLAEDGMGTGQRQQEWVGCSPSLGTGKGGRNCFTTMLFLLSLSPVKPSLCATHGLQVCGLRIGESGKSTKGEEKL